MEYWLGCWKKYAVFSGRARRKEYWKFVEVNFIIAVAIALPGMLGAVKAAEALWWVGNLFNLAVLLPGLAVCARRLHDIGKSGWWMLIALVPFIGAIVLLVFMCLDSQPGENEYGPNPKE